jgi:hypothetical protein
MERKSEDFYVQELISELRVEAPAVAVLPSGVMGGGTKSEENFVISSEEFGSLKRAQGLLRCWVENGACSPPSPRLLPRVQAVV